MLAKIGIAIGAPFLLMSIVVGATGVVVVDVAQTVSRLRPEHRWGQPIRFQRTILA